MNDNLARLQAWIIAQIEECEPFDNSDYNSGMLGAYESVLDQIEIYKGFKQ